MQKIVIELMKVDDIKNVLEVEEKSFTIPWHKESFENELKNNLALYLVAKVENKAVGYVGVWRVLDEGHITNVAVHPDYRRRGIAKALVSELLLLCEKDGITSFTLEVRKSNKVAYELYKKLGFKEEGIRKKYYADNNEDAIIMWKKI
ncbi:MAG: ribosomal protein S18-alanine N-acetyltransferase [Clostridia bacterium]|nr:ribosomal protein S18-alanine N-acetyltransferase [Clostridia bacterium]